MRALSGLVFLALVTHTSTAVAQTWSPEQQEIWRLEEQQWKMAAAKDLTWIETMVDPNISFWDVDFPAPQNKARPSASSPGTSTRRRSPRTTPRDQQIMMISLSGPVPPRVLADYIQYSLREKLQTIPGVGEISVMGIQSRNVRIWLDATKLEEKSLTVRDVMSALQREHVELPAGRLESPGREVNVRVLGEALDIETLRRIVVREVDGAPVYIEEVSLVEDGFDDTRMIARLNRVPAQGLSLKSDE